MIHRLLYMLAGFFTALGAMAMLTKPDSGLLGLLSGVLAYFFAYVKEHHYHITILRRHVAALQKPPP